MLGRIVASYEADPSLQQELLQEVSVGIWRALPKLRDQSSLKAYVARVAQNICLTHVRKAVRAPRSVELDQEMPSNKASPEDDALDTQKRQMLEAAVRALPLTQKQVVTLALEGFNYGEIAETLGITENNAMVRFNRAKSELSQVLSNKGKGV